MYIFRLWSSFSWPLSLSAIASDSVGAPLGRVSRNEFPYICSHFSLSAIASDLVALVGALHGLWLWNGFPPGTVIFLASISAVFLDRGSTYAGEKTPRNGFL